MTRLRAYALQGACLQIVLVGDDARPDVTYLFSIAQGQDPSYLVRDLHKLAERIERSAADLAKPKPEPKPVCICTDGYTSTCPTCGDA